MRLMCAQEGRSGHRSNGTTEVVVCTGIVVASVDDLDQLMRVVCTKFAVRFYNRLPQLLRAQKDGADAEWAGVTARLELMSNDLVVQAKYNVVESTRAAVSDTDPS